MFCGSRKYAERSRAHGQRSAGPVAGQCQARFERAALTFRKAVEVFPQGQQEIRGGGERQDRLGFLPPQPDHPGARARRRDVGQMSKQGGLAHSCLTDHHRGTACGVKGIDQSHERLLLNRSADQSSGRMPRKVTCH